MEISLENLYVDLGALRVKLLISPLIPKSNCCQSKKSQNIPNLSFAKSKDLKWSDIQELCQRGFWYLIVTPQDEQNDKKQIFKDRNK